MADGKSGFFQKAVIIFNPESGQGSALPSLFRALLGLKRAALPQGREHTPVSAVTPIQERLLAEGISTKIALTSGPGSATALARESVAAGCDLVVAVGGDGTVNEVVNGLAGTDTALGVIPTGTVNLFSLQMHLPTEITEACRILAEGRTRRIDLGRVGGRYFLCVAGIGFDADVIRKTDSRFKHLAGAVAYAWVAVWRFFSYPFKIIHLQVDDDSCIRRGYLLIVGNGPYYGGDMKLMPSADPADGLLDACLFKRRHWWNLLGYLWGLRRGALERYHDVEYFQCRKLQVGKKGRHAVHVDAEYLGRTPVAVGIEPGALRVVVDGRRIPPVIS